MLLPALAAAGCSKSHKGDVSLGAGRASVCYPTKGSVTDGWLVVRNLGTSKAELRGVSLAGATGLSLGKTYLVPVTNNLIGILQHFPPPSSATGPGSGWDQRRAVTGTTLPVYHKGHDLNLVVELIPTGSGAHTSTGLQVAYRQYSHNQTTTSGMTIKIAPTCP